LRRGVPNFFGPQRQGKSGENYHVPLQAHVVSQFLSIPSLQSDSRTPAGTP
jgi:tRNA(Glu) U13 pseudouridine synthase TruD